MPHLEEGVVGALRGEDLAGNVAREAEGIIANVDVLLNLRGGERRFTRDSREGDQREEKRNADLSDTLRLDLAHLESDELAKGLEVGAELLADLADDLTALGGGDTLPLLLGLLESGDGGLVVSLKIGSEFRSEWKKGGQWRKKVRKKFMKAEERTVEPPRTRAMTSPVAGLTESNHSPLPPHLPLKTPLFSSERPRALRKG